MFLIRVSYQIYEMFDNSLLLLQIITLESGRRQELNNSCREQSAKRKPENRLGHLKEISCKSIRGKTIRTVSFINPFPNFVTCDLN